MKYTIRPQTIFGQNRDQAKMGPWSKTGIQVKIGDKAITGQQTRLHHWAKFDTRAKIYN